MAKSRLNKKEVRRLQQKQNFAVATQVKLLAEGLANQQQLEAFLMQQPDVTKRRAMYDFCAPFLKFSGHHFPSTIQIPGIIITG